MSSAPPVLACEGLGLRSGSGWLFRGLDLFLGRGDRLALVGRNGAGKTTLLRLIAGQIEADEGRRTLQPGLKVVLLEQDPSVEGVATLGDFAAAGGAPAHLIAKAADGIGIDLSREAATASGGERRRAAIARAVAAEPDVILLDEPTNHLDLHGIEWLEAWLARFRGAFIAISHDRAFLSRLTRSSLWLERGTLKRAEVGFGGFEAWTEQHLAEEARTAERLDTKLKAELEWLHKGVTARRKRNQGRLAKLGELRAQRAAMLGPAGRAKLGLANEADARSKTVIDAAGVTKRFGERAVIRDFTLRIQRGDRIGIVGANGSGKTTLLRLLTGELEPDAGTIRRAKTLTGIVVDQQRRLLEPDKRVRDILADGGDWVDVRGQRTHVVGYLKDFLFDPGLVDARVGTLSGGERSRLLLAREFAREANLLVLDEPTNDLDLETLDLLQEVIADYEGTVLLVSHDRDFLDRTVTVTLGLDGSGRVDVVAGGYADWERKRTPRSSPSSLGEGDHAKRGGGALRPSHPAPPPSADADGPPPRASSGRNKLSYKDQRDLDRLPALVEDLTARIARDEAALADPALYARDPARFARLTQAIADARAERDAAEMRWLEVAEAAEALG